LDEEMSAVRLIAGIMMIAIPISLFNGFLGYLIGQGETMMIDELASFIMIFFSGVTSTLLVIGGVRTIKLVVKLNS
jgi:hypothetical protein